jgi:hypothetical protein
LIRLTAKGKLKEMAEDYCLSTLLMDRGQPLGNSEDSFTRRALHVKVGNKNTEAIPVTITNAPTSSATYKNEFNQISAVPTSVETLIHSYTIPVGKVFTLTLVEVGGENVATYNVYLNGVLFAVRRTEFMKLNEEFQFYSTQMIASDIITIKVIHYRSVASKHETRIYGVLQNA